jgi:hypothetical protein
LNTNPHAAAANFDDGDANLLTDQDPFANFSRDDQHEVNSFSQPASGFEGLGLQNASIT